MSLASLPPAPPRRRRAALPAPLPLRCQTHRSRRRLPRQDPADDRRLDELAFGMAAAEADALFPTDAAWW
jgi:hypothetical protein